MSLNRRPKYWKNRDFLSFHLNFSLSAKTTITTHDSHDVHGTPVVISWHDQQVCDYLFDLWTEESCELFIHHVDQIEVRNSVVSPFFSGYPIESTQKDELVMT